MKLLFWYRTTVYRVRRKMDDRYTTTRAPMIASLFVVVGDLLFSNGVQSTEY
jgi:hypothetical protein